MNYDTNVEFEWLTVPAKTEELDNVQDFLRERLEGADCEMGPQMQVELAVEEVFVNVASYAYVPGEGDVEVGIRILAEPRCAEIVFRDRGVPYNPLEKEAADLSEEAIMDREGGLGIFLTLEVMDDVSYRYENGCNELTLRKEFE